MFIHSSLSFSNLDPPRKSVIRMSPDSRKNHPLAALSEAEWLRWHHQRYRECELRHAKTRQDTHVFSQQRGSSQTLVSGLRQHRLTKSRNTKFRTPPALWTLLNILERCFGAQDRNRTGTRGLASTDFKSVVSTYFTTRACSHFTLFKTLR